MGLDLFKLRVFVTVVDHRGYSAAAVHLGLSQSTVSFHVHGLERHLGVPLVRYEHRTVRLTAAGEHVYRSAKRMLRDEQQLTVSLRGGHGGRAALGVSMAFEQAFFMERTVSPYRREHSDVLLSLHFGHSLALVEALEEHSVDLAYLIGWHMPAGLHFEFLHRARFALLVTPDHPLAREEVVTMEQVAEAGLIGALLDDVEQLHNDKILREAGLGPGDIRLEVDGVQARMLAAASGLGVVSIFLPPYAGPGDLGGLVELPVDRELPVVDVGLVTRRTDTPPWYVQELGDWIRTSTTTRG